MHVIPLKYLIAVIKSMKYRKKILINENGQKKKKNDDILKTI